MTELISTSIRSVRPHSAMLVLQRADPVAQRQLWWLPLKMRLRTVREPLRGNRQDGNLLILGMPPSLGSS